jgi:hypothetical protein
MMECIDTMSLFLGNEYIDVRGCKLFPHLRIDLWPKFLTYDWKGFIAIDVVEEIVDLLFLV